MDRRERERERERENEQTPLKRQYLDPYLDTYTRTHPPPRHVCVCVCVCVNKNHFFCVLSFLSFSRFCFPRTNTHDFPHHVPSPAFPAPYPTQPAAPPPIPPTNTPFQPTHHTLQSHAATRSLHHPLPKPPSPPSWQLTRHSTLPFTC